MKFKLLKSRLQQPWYVVVGVLESLWQLTLSSATDGAIGKFSDAEIAAWMEWPGDASALIGHLVDTKFIDRCEVNRLVVHDWPEHAPEFLKSSFKRWGKKFATVVSHDPQHDATDNQRHDPQHDAKDASLAHPPNLTKPNLTKEIHAKASLRVTWLTPFGEAWQEIIQGEFKYPKAAKELKTLCDKHGAEETLKCWRTYLEAHGPERATFASAAKFSETFGQWSHGTSARSNLPTAEDDANWNPNDPRYR